jgi:hypothetical protein
MIKTFLGLPRRVTGLKISRKDFTEISESFPRLLDALEAHASDRLSGLNLGEIEWYHRLRNELYHDGNGLTVEKDKVEVYAELAKVLFKNLFAFDLVRDEEDGSQALGRFLAAWVDIERLLAGVTVRSLGTSRPVAHDMLVGARKLAATGKLAKDDVRELESFRRVRNQVVHGVADYRAALTLQVVDQIRSLRDRISQAMMAASLTPMRPTAKEK